MIKEDANNMSYEDFLEEYVIHPDYYYCFTFSYKGNTYQFDYDFKTHPEVNNIMPYCFVVYGKEIEKIGIYTRTEVLSCTWYSSFLEAINSVRIEGKSFKEIYHDPDSEIIDLN